MEGHLHTGWLSLLELGEERFLWIALALLGVVLFAGLGYLRDRQRRLASRVENLGARPGLLERVTHSPAKKVHAVRLPPSVQSVLAGLAEAEEAKPPLPVADTFEYDDPDKTSVSALLEDVKALSAEGAEEARTWVMAARTRVVRVRDGRQRG